MGGFQLGAGHWYNYLPPPLGKSIPAGRARILDITTVSTTNGQVPTKAATAAWKSVESTVRAYKRTTQNVTASQTSSWFTQLAAAQTTLWPLRGSECSDQSG